MVPVVNISDIPISNCISNIYRELEASAVFGPKHMANWLVPQRRGNRFVLEKLGNSLYDGLAGIGLFLAALEKTCTEYNIRKLCLSTFATLIHQYRENGRYGIGGATGTGSIIYALVRSGQLIHHDQFIDHALEISQHLTPDKITNDHHYDVMDGAAGTLLALLALYEATGKAEILDRAIYCGEHCLENRTKSFRRYQVWKTVENKALTGFAHGSSGIAYALMRLFEICRNDVFLKASEEAILFEQDLFNTSIKNWSISEPINVNSKKLIEPTFQNTWCYGAVGIGLSRIGVSHLLTPHQIKNDIQHSINQSYDDLRVLESDMHHLCCGTMGRIELLITAGTKLCDCDAMRTAVSSTLELINIMNKRGYFNLPEIVPGLHTPSLFQGITGIGYEMLRILNPDKIPSVLLWE
ncbi:lanthionine synthetase LanC family protein [Fulvivirgaceae bacterium BMA10]|uniref:Lanthionine synthetase LanC family protein n=1 Tax=Splendidivirga corallicola TaxID=3051826 RepID=A0ABT8KTR5_9BACT|nr:lanthionine synthetase LanC family protein [Fulvivirgaceae bacterium BMA10]